MWKIAALGCGGIGFHLGEGLGRLLANMKKPPELYLVDGDVIEDKNCERQFYKGVVGHSKAVALATIIADRFPGVGIIPVPSYLNADTIKIHRGRWLYDKVLILSGVDNNATRCFLEDEILKLRNVILISGGNEVTDGQVHIFVRKGNKNISPTMSQMAPEMRHDPGVVPGTEGHCLEKGVSDPQTALVNRTVAVAMEAALGYFIKQVITPRKPEFNEIRIDTKKCSMKGFWRNPVPGL